MITLHLSIKEAKVLKACLNEGTKLMYRLFLSPYADEKIKKMAKHDSLIITIMMNKVISELRRHV